MIPEVDPCVPENHEGFSVPTVTYRLRNRVEHVLHIQCYLHEAVFRIKS